MTGWERYELLEKITCHPEKVLKFIDSLANSLCSKCIECEHFESDEEVSYEPRKCLSDKWDCYYFLKENNYSLDGYCAYCNKEFIINERSEKSSGHRHLCDNCSNLIRYLKNKTEEERRCIKMNRRCIDCGKKVNHVWINLRRCKSCSKKIKHLAKAGNKEDKFFWDQMLLMEKCRNKKNQI